MAQCFDMQQNKYVYCSSSFGTYIAVGIILPLAILIIIILISGYVRYKRRRSMRVQQQMNMTAVVTINNSEGGEQQQAPYNYSFPPNYTSVVDSTFDKPPSYEQTVQNLSEFNSTSENTTAAAVLPITTVTSLSLEDPVQSSRNQT